MINVIVSAIIVVIVGAALAYIVKSKKNGIKCVGCPDAKYCSAESHGSEGVSSCGCGGTSCAGCSGCHTAVK